MDEQMRNKLMEKYLDGTSTLQEEEDLLGADAPEALEAWATFVQSERVEQPKGLSIEVMTAIEEKAKSKRRFLYRVSSMAAAVALLLSFWFISSREKGMTYQEKADLLEQVLSEFPAQDNAIAESNVIYEDELLVVYLTNK